MEGEISFGHWLRQRRKQHDLTQEELAERVVCSTDTIRKIESGARRPSREIAERLADIFAIPSAERAAFIRRARAEQSVQREDLPSVAASPAAASSTPSRTMALPQQLTPFVGRDEELAALGHLIADPAHRLITIVGPGGMGKTRLALQAAAQQQDRFSDGIIWVSLASVQSSSLIASSLADALGLTFPTTADLETQLIRYLQNKHLLLVLDNFEHLMDGVALLVRLLEQAPQVTLLVTSRVRLNLLEEWIWELGGLALPSATSAEALEASGAVALFAQSARRARHDFRLTPDNYAAVVRICTLVDGMPLGIELAATWVRMLSLDDIVQEIERSLDFLETTLWNVPARHRSLRAVFHHSWSLLSEQERTILCRLSIFRGGFTREAAAHVAGATLRHLAALVDQSLLRRISTDHYDMHPVVRQYVAAELATMPNEEHATRDRHSAYYAAWLQRRDRLLRETQQMVVFAELRAEVDNLRLAWDWMVTHHKITEIVQATQCLSYFYDIQAWFKEAEAAFGRAVQALERIPPGEKEAFSAAEYTTAYALVLGRQAWFKVRIGQIEQGQTSFRKAIALLPADAPPFLVLWQHLMFGYTQFIAGNGQEAEQHWQQSLRLARAHDDQWGMTYSLSMLGQLACAQGDLHKAQQVLHEALAVGRVRSAPRSTAYSLQQMGMVLLATGDLEAARTHLQEALALSQTLKDRWALLNNFRLLGQVALAQHNEADARTFFEESLALCKEIGEFRMMALVLLSIGDVHSAHDERQAAAQHFREALHAAHQAHVVAVQLDSLARLAEIFHLDGQHQRAMELCRLILEHPAASAEAKQRTAFLYEQLRAIAPTAAQDGQPARSLEDLTADILAISLN